MNRSTKKQEIRDDNDIGCVGDSGPEKLSMTRPAPLVSYVGDGVLGAPGKGCSVASSCSSRVAQAANLLNPNKSAVLGDREYDGRIAPGRCRDDSAGG